MSYSFDFAAPSKDEAKARVASELDSIVAQQPAHAKDRAAAQAAANAVIDLIADDDAMDIRVSMHGSVGWRTSLSDGDQYPLTQASVGVNAWHIPKQVPANE
jgi:hypothetical protein